MPTIPESTIDQVRQAVDIVEVISDHVILNKKGRNHLGLCPFHEDRNPSFNVSQDKQIYKCFACGEGGNVFTFLIKIEGISFIEALRQLAQRSGFPLPENNQETKENFNTFDALYNANEFARKYYHHLLLKHHSGAEARKYLKNRAISEETQETFSLGYAPNAWDSFVLAAKRRGFDPQILESAGLVLSRKDGNGHYDRFRHRIMFPIQAHTGRTVAFGARAINPEEQIKYLNSPETPVYRKNAILYGLWQNRNSIRTKQLSLIVEGYMDLITLVQQGIPHIVATSGTALTLNHAHLLRRYVERIILVFDGDKAGETATIRGIETLFESGLDVRVASLPKNHDPDSFIKEQGTKALNFLIENATPALDFLIDCREDLSTSNGKARAVTSLATLISRIGDRTLRTFLTKETAEKLGVNEDTLIQSIRNVNKRPLITDNKKKPRKNQGFDPKPRSERELLTQMMANNLIADRILKQIKIDDFTNSFYKRIAILISDRRKKGQDAGVELLQDQSLTSDIVQIISALSMEVGITNPDQQELPLQDYINNFRLKNLDAKIQALKKEIKSSDPDTDLKIQLIKLARQRDLTAQRKALVESRQHPY